MRNISRAFEVKAGRGWKQTFYTEDKETVYESLATDLMYLKVFKSPMYKRLVQYSNYDGTRTIIVYQDNGRSVYIVKA